MFRFGLIMTKEGLYMEKLGTAIIYYHGLLQKT